VWVAGEQSFKVALFMRTSEFGRRYDRAVQEGLRRALILPPVTEADLAPLPPPVQTYLWYAGALGRPRVRSVQARFTGSFRTSRQGGWMKMTAEQTNFFDEPTRLFSMKARRWGLPFEGLHVFRGASATMEIRLASFLPLVNARGPEMNQSETVTLFNDMCLLAPATLIDPRIEWEPVDGLTARARFTNQGITIGAKLRFTRGGELVDFVSNDRFLSADGKSFRSYPWSTPVRGYRDFAGRQVWTEGEAVWHTPEGGFTYGRFELQEVAYNLKAVD
jgi:hypothetical protein